MADDLTGAVNVLVIEETESCGAAVERALRQGGYTPYILASATTEIIQTALRETRWHIAFYTCDRACLSLPEAMALFAANGQDIPLFAVSCDADEKKAPECMQAGARDFFLKNNLSRLCSAVARETAQAGLREKSRAAETRLQDSTDTYRMIVENAQEAIIITQEMNIVFTNRQTLTMTGYSREEVASRGTAGLIHPDDLARVAENHRRRLAGEPVVPVYTFRVITRSGDIRWAEIKPTLISWKGKPATLNFLTDITEKRQSQEMLEMLRLTIEHHFDGAYWMDNQNRFVHVNSAGCATLGYTREELIGSHVSKVNPNVSGPILDRVWERLRLEGAYKTESFHRRKDGSEFPVEITATYVCVGDKEYNCGFARDITERKSVQETQARLTAILENTSDVVATATPEGKVTYLNYAGRQMAGWMSNEPLEKRTIADFHPADSSNTVLNEGLPAAAAAGVWTGETEVLHKSGRTIPVSQVIIAHRVSAGFVQYYSTIMRDISERKLAEKILQDSIQKLGAAQEAAKIGFWDLDLSIMHLEWSEGVKSIFDLAPDGPTPTFDEFWGYVLSDDREFVTAQVNAQLKPMDKPSITYEYRILTSKGKTKCIEHIGRQSLSPDGVLLRIYGSVQDITERRQVEEALRVSETRYKAQYQGSPIPTFTWQKYGDDFVLVNFNDAAQGITLGKASEFVGSAATQLYQDNPEIVANIRRCHQERIIIRDEITSQHFLPGRQIQTTYAFVPPDFVLVHIEDLTERRRAEADREKLQKQLLQSQKLEAIGRLAGGVAHDFNNMLAVIIGHAELALDHIDPESPPYADLQAIRKATEHSAGLVRQLLAFARKQTITPRIIHLSEAVQNMFNILKRLIGEDIDLALKAPANLWPVRIDPGQVDQILANLCINARDAITGPGRIMIEVRNVACAEMSTTAHEEAPPGDYVLLAVSDSGCGMDAAMMGKIFEPFFTTKEIGKGSGLGLSTVYGIVSQNNGAVHVESVPGRGTTFSIYLPRYWGETEKNPAATKTIQTESGHETILLVEDESSLLKMTDAMLRRLGYSVLPAATPGEAVRLASEHPGDIHLLITDVIMPEMNGRDLAVKLLSIRPGLRCLFMSGYTADVIAKQGILNESLLFIQKPFQKKHLAAKVRAALEKTPTGNMKNEIF